jgi:KDO2-lipid IV(A) lauroyltransferase
MAVVYLHVEKVKRGYYRASFIPISYEPKDEPPHLITKRYFEELEAQIQKEPEYYLWTHKRWKHRGASIPHEAVVINQDRQSV